MAKLTEEQIDILARLQEDDDDPVVGGMVIDHATAKPLEDAELIVFYDIWHFGAVSNVYRITDAGRAALAGEGK